MVRARGPLMSMSAQKQLGKSLIYKQKGSRSFITGYGKPGSKNPFTPSALQLEKRARYGLLVGLWKAKSQSEKDVYNDDPRTTELRISGFNLFIKLYFVVLPWINTKSVLLDGGNEYININGVLINSLATTTKGTWSLWVKPVDATPSGTEMFIAFGDTNATEVIRMRIRPSGELIADLYDAGVKYWDVQTDSVIFSDNTWIHLALVQDGISPVLYVDGVAVPQTFTDSTDKTKWFNDLTGLDNGRIGCQNLANLTNVNFFNGNVDEVLFINRDLSAAQILDIYNAGSPKDESGITDGVTMLRLGDHANDNYNSDVANEWRFYDSIGSNNADSVNLEEADVEEDVP